MRLAITGGDGFIGRAVARHLLDNGVAPMDLLLVDRSFATPPASRYLAGDLLNPDILSRATEGCDAMLHLASLPGAASERNPGLAHDTNVALSLQLIEAMAGRRLVLAGSIAVFGSAPQGAIDDDSKVCPDSVYGTQKAMVELAFSDAIRRNSLHGMVLRLSGIVARPTAATGFGSVWMSDIFHAARCGMSMRIPVATDATIWIASLSVTSRNLARGLTAEWSESRPITLPALHVRIGDLVDRLAEHCPAARFTHEEDPAVRRMFASYPWLKTPLAKSLGFEGDADVSALIDAVLADLPPPDATATS